MKQQDFVLTRVVTRDFVRDFFEGLRNFFGLRLRSYEKMIQKASTEMLEEMRLTYKNIKWYKMDIEHLSKNSAMIVIYGELG